MNKQTERNAARFILFGMLCSIVVTIGGAFSEAKDVAPVVTTEETIVKSEPIYSFNVSAGVHKVIWENAMDTDNTEAVYTQNENEIVQTGVETTEEVTEKPENIAKDGTQYRYYKVIDDGYQTALSDELQEYTYDLCVEYNITEYFTLILCQLYKESTYREDIISSSNDYGIAQINICNHEWLSEELGITDFLDPRQSILCNIYLMSENLQKYDVESSLICYNAGSSNSSSSRAKQYARDIVALWNNCIVEK